MSCPAAWWSMSMVLKGGSFCILVITLGEHLVPICCMFWEYQFCYHLQATHCQPWVGHTWQAIHWSGRVKFAIPQEPKLNWTLSTATVDLEMPYPQIFVIWRHCIKRGFGLKLSENLAYCILDFSVLTCKQFFWLNTTQLGMEIFVLVH